MCLQQSDVALCREYSDHFQGSNLSGGERERDDNWVQLSECGKGKVQIWNCIRATSQSPRANESTVIELTSWPVTWTVSKRNGVGRLHKWFARYLLPLKTQVPGSAWSKVACAHIRGAHSSHFWSIFFHFCRHRPSKMKWKMNRKMRTVNPPPLKFWKMRSKMSEKWNSTFFGTPAALNSTSRGRPCSILSFPQCLLSASNLPWVFTDWSSVH